MKLQYWYSIKMLDFHPPLLNSSNRWATTKTDLQTLYNCPHTGAITTRTSSLTGFPHDDAIHQHRYFDPTTLEIIPHTPSSSCAIPEFHHASILASSHPSSINTLGYSPLSLSTYIDFIRDIETNLPPTQRRKPVIFSVTGTPTEIAKAHSLLLSSLPLDGSSTWLLEINLSCPNIPGKPPPAYSRSELETYLLALPLPPTTSQQGDLTSDARHIRVGIKTPPYTHKAQFDAVIEALLATSAETGLISGSSRGLCPVSFLSATNTLGSSLALSLPSQSSTSAKVSPNIGIGGLAGSSLHPLALGNVHTLRTMLNAHEVLREIEIIGIGGVADGSGYHRMKAAGAVAVGVGTALGFRGVGVFGDILEG